MSQRVRRHVGAIARGPLWVLAAQLAVAPACGGRAYSDAAGPAASGAPGVPGSAMSPSRPAGSGRPSPGLTPAPGSSPPMLPRPAGSGAPAPLPPEPVDPRPLEPVPVPPTEPGLRDCDQGRIARPTTQAELEALRGCSSLYGLSVEDPLDLRPLESLRVVGDGGLVLLADMPLAGLENVEETGGLALYNMRALDLSALKSLRFAQSLVLGSVVVSDLKGLERVQGIRSLSLSSSPAIVSLDGFIPPSQMDFVVLQDLSGLKDTSALRYVTSVSNQLWIERTAIEALPFTALAGSTLYVALVDNPQLADISSLRNLESIDGFTLSGSGLTSAPVFERLTRLDGFFLSYNSFLTASPAFPAIRSISVLDVSDNHGLTSLRGFSALESATYITISRNDQLTQIDLGQLRESSMLFIYGNRGLDGAAAARDLAGVTSDQSRIPVSQAPELPITPCPWTQDPICDSDLCSPREDPACGGAF